MSLDADLVAEFERGGPLSSEINEALRAEFERRRNRAALKALVEELSEQYDGLDTPEDREEIARFRDLLA